jgi:hypothetical protein
VESGDDSSHLNPLHLGVTTVIGTTPQCHNRREGGREGRREGDGTALPITAMAGDDNADLDSFFFELLLQHVPLVPLLSAAREMEGVLSLRPTYYTGVTQPQTWIEI